MLTLGFSRRIFLRRGATDMRKSFDSLAGLVRSEFAADPLSGDAFVFVGKAVNRVKILVFDRSGFWVLSKRLSSGHFGVAGRWQAGGDAKAVRVELSSAELQLCWRALRFAMRVIGRNIGILRALFRRREWWYVGAGGG
jgi:transposase